MPVDISEANKNPKMKDYYFGNLTEDRVTFTTGRDIDLVPEQSRPAAELLHLPLRRSRRQAVARRQDQAVVQVQGRLRKVSGIRNRGQNEEAPARRSLGPLR